MYWDGGSLPPPGNASKPQSAPVAIPEIDPRNPPIPLPVRFAPVEKPWEKAGPNAPAGCQVAGMGCGTVSLKFKAINKGISTVNASRTSCGEALRCTPAQSSYYVTIKVN